MENEIHVRRLRPTGIYLYTTAVIVGKKETKNAKHNIINPPDLRLTEII